MDVLVVQGRAMSDKRDFQSRFSVIASLVRLRPTPARHAVLFASPHRWFVAAISPWRSH